MKEIKGNLAVIMIIVLIVISIGFGGYFIYRSYAKTDQTEQQVNQTYKSTTQAQETTSIVQNRTDFSSIKIDNYPRFLMRYPNSWEQKKINNETYTLTKEDIIVQINIIKNDTENSIESFCYTEIEPVTESVYRYRLLPKSGDGVIEQPLPERYKYITTGIEISKILPDDDLFDKLANLQYQEDKSNFLGCVSGTLFTYKLENLNQSTDVKNNSWVSIKIVGNIDNKEGILEIDQAIKNMQGVVI